MTADLPGIGGIIKRFNEDFLVEEIPLYLPSGEGTHIYFGIEKQGLTTLAAIDIVARALGKRPWDIGYAGLKDAHAVTRQTLSVEHVDPQRVGDLDLGRIKVLWVNRHTNKLKLGHLRGNRFVLRIREAVPKALDPASAIMEVLIRRGVPNYFGPQRFGARGDNALIGAAAVQGNFTEAMHWMLGRPGPLDNREVLKARELFESGQYQDAANMWPKAFRQQKRVCTAMHKTGGDAAKGWSAVDHTLRKLYLSAVQSLLFNQVVAERIAAIDRLEEGDLAWKHVNGACFRVEDVATEQPRCDAFEISPTGPLFGGRMTEAGGAPGQRERRVLDAAGLDTAQFGVEGKIKMDGARRPLRVPLLDPEVREGRDERGPYLELAFGLPPGSYATGVAREICKTSEQGSAAFD